MGEGNLGPVDTTYRLSDLFAVNFRAWRTYLRALIVVELFFVALILVFPLLDGFNMVDAIRYADWWFPALAPIPLLILWFGLCPFIVYWRSKRLRMLGPHQFSFNEKGIQTRSPTAESLIYWSGIKRLLVTRTRLFLFVTRASALIIPKREFDSDEEFGRWISFADAACRDAKSVTVE